MSRTFEEFKSGSVVVKLYTRHRWNRVFYRIADYSSGKRKMLEFSDYDEAKRKASDIARKINQGEKKILQLKDKDAFAYQGAMDLLRPTGQQLDVAIAEFVEARQILNGLAGIAEAARFFIKRHGSITRKTVPEILDELKESLLTKSRKYQEDIRLRLGQFAEDNQGFIGHITHLEIAAWLRSLKLQPRSQDNFRKLIVTLFRFAVDRGYLPQGETEAERVKPIEGEEGDIEIFSPKELQQLLKAAGAFPEAKPYLLLGAFAGVRTEEIKRLDWKEINLQTGYIEIKKGKAKTKSRRLIPIHDNLKAWLKPLAKASGALSSLLFPERVAYDEIAPACVPPLAWKRNGLRHSYCSYRMAIAQNENIVSSEMGNSAEMIFKNYRELVTKEQAAEWFNIYPESKSND